MYSVSRNVLPKPIIVQVAVQPKREFVPITTAKSKPSRHHAFKPFHVSERFTRKLIFQLDAMFEQITDTEYSTVDLGRLPTCKPKITRFGLAGWSYSTVVR